MPSRNSSRLNDSGEMLLTRITHGAAVHVGRGEQTLEHSQYAWKIHVGLDAPVWLRSRCSTVELSSVVRAVVVPPGLTHRVGASGWSSTIMLAPGTRSTPWSSHSAPTILGGAAARRLVDASLAFRTTSREDIDHLVSECVRLTFKPGNPTVDSRVRRALVQLGHAPETPLHRLATDQRLSLDRLSHLVTRDTGTVLRRHALWSRLTRLLSSNVSYASLAAAAAEAGFSDHAHMTRVYRDLLGRLPSEFTAPPDAVNAWFDPSH